MVMEKTGESPGAGAPAAAAPAKKKNGFLVLLPVLLVAAAVGCAGYWWYRQQQRFVTTDDAGVEATRITVSSKVPGRIARLFIDEGDTVSPGDTVALLDKTDLLAQLGKIRAMIGLYTVSEQAAGVKLAVAEDDFARTKKQFDNGIITLEQFTHAKSAVDLASVQVKIAAAQTATARADLEVIGKNIDNTILCASSRCVAAKKWLTEGDVIQPGQAIFTMYDMEDCWITARCEETKMRHIREGSPVDITLDAFPTRLLRGHVGQMGISTASQFSLLPAGNAAGNFTKVTQRIPVKIVLDSTGTDGISLLPGLSATVRIVAR